MTVIELAPRPQTSDPDASDTVFAVRVRSDEIRLIHGASGYQPEGPLTTFFFNDRGKPVMDAWSTRIASLRTEDIISITRQT